LVLALFATSSATRCLSVLLGPMNFASFCLRCVMLRGSDHKSRTRVMP
jgi:hypothetical protein